MTDSHLVFVPHEHAHGACSLLEEAEKASPDGTKARAAKNVMKLISNSLGAAKGWGAETKQSMCIAWPSVRELFLGRRADHPKPA